MGLFGKKKESMNDLGGPPPFPNSPDEMNQPMPDVQQNAPQGYGQQNYYNQPGQQDMNPMGPDADQMAQDPYTQQQNMRAGYGQQYPEQGIDPNFPSPQFQQPYPAEDNTKERVEEIAEAIIDEKWNELVRDINKVIEWKERTDGELKKIQQEIENLKERFESLHKGVLGKISEYDQNLTNVGTEIKSMEMVFQKILPTFTENINKLDRLVKSTGSRTTK